MNRRAQQRPVRHECWADNKSPHPTPEDTRIQGALSLRVESWQGRGRTFNDPCWCLESHPGPRIIHALPTLWTRYSNRANTKGQAENDLGARAKIGRHVTQESRSLEKGATRRRGGAPADPETYLHYPHHHPPLQAGFRPHRDSRVPQPAPRRLRGQTPAPLRQSQGTCHAGWIPQAPTRHRTLSTIRLCCLASCASRVCGY